MPSATMSVKKCGKEKIGNPCKENEFRSPRRLRSQMINEIKSVKVENVHGTPKKTDNPQSFNNKNCTNENSSPQKNRYLLNQKDLPQSPVFKMNKCKENEFGSPRRLRSQMINEIKSAKVENVHGTPKKTDNPQSFNNKNYTNENSSPQKNRYLLNQKDLPQSPVFKMNKCKENEFRSPRRLRSQMINEIKSAKVENVDGTPKKTDNPQNFNNKNCTNENSSPQKNRYLFNQDLPQSPLLKSPVFKMNKCVDSTQMDTCSQRKRTISMNSDMFKLELYNTENFNDFEDINLLHDLDFVINFENDTLLSTMMDVDTPKKDDSLTGMNKDPVTSPLAINDYEKKDTETFVKSNLRSNLKRKCKIEKVESKKVESKPQVKKQSSHHVRKYKLKMKQEHFLKELKNFEEWEDIPLSALEKLMKLSIKLTHKVPPQHKIELSGSHAPTRKMRILFQKHGPIRKGAYTPLEDKVIRNNWEMFCELHDWNIKRTEPFLYWKHNWKYHINDVKERKKFVQFLASGLPWRTLYSVYSRFKVLYRNKITCTRYTPEDDKKILMYMQNKCGTKCSELAKILKRTNRSILKRYQYLQSQTQDESETKPLVDVRWTLPLIKKYIKTLLSITLSEDVRELKNATFPKPLWQKMEEKLNIHQNVLKTFWQHQLHLQLFSTGPIYLNDIKIQLIEYMYIKGISNTREIIWPNVAKYFDGATAIFLHKIFFYLVRECNMNDENNFGDVVEYLYNTKIPEIQKAPNDKFLPKIIYENEKISLINEKNS